MLSDERDATMRKRARDEVNVATDAAEAAPFPTDEDVFRHVTSETSGPLSLEGRGLG